MARGGILVRDRKEVAINNRDIRSQCLTIPFYTTCQKCCKIHPIEYLHFFSFASFRERTRTLILGVKNAPYVKENVNVRCRRAVKIVLLLTVRRIRLACGQQIKRTKARRGAFTRAAILQFRKGRNFFNRGDGLEFDLAAAARSCAPT